MFGQRQWLLLSWLSLVCTAVAFTPPCQVDRPSCASPGTIPFAPSSLYMTQDEETEQEVYSSCWNPALRRIMGSVASLGVAETAFLTYEKVAGNIPDLCGTNGDCESVLTGPYSTIPILDIPISALGCVAYATVTVLALAPLLSEQEDDTTNRIALLAVTTAMGTFSAFLVSLLWGVLHTSCPYCLASASFSFTLAACAWLGGFLPSAESKKGVQYSLASLATTTLAAVAFFFSVDSDPTSSMATYAGSNPANAPSTLLASSTTKKEGLAPPPIETSSSERALALSQNLAALNAKMYGAYWCSHCYDQKTLLGKQGFAKIDYVECSKDGLNSQTPMCKAKDVPGYPTWEIGGKLFPGEMELDELEDIVKEVMTK